MRSLYEESQFNQSDKLEIGDIWPDVGGSHSIFFLFILM